MPDKDFADETAQYWKNHLKDLDPIFKSLKRPFNDEERALLGSYLSLRGYMNNADPSVINLYILKRQEEMANKTIESNEKLAKSYNRVRKSFSWAIWGLFSVALSQIALMIWVIFSK